MYLIIVLLNKKLITHRVDSFLILDENKVVRIKEFTSTGALMQIVITYFLTKCIIIV